MILSRPRSQWGWGGRRQEGNRTIHKASRKGGAGGARISYNARDRV